MKERFTLYTKPQAEYQVAAALQARGFELYLPEIEAIKPRQGHNRRPFFPCYLFVQLDLESIGLSQLQWTPGLRRMVSVDGRPASLSQEMIDLVRRRLGDIKRSGGLARFKPGERVKIVEGPFSEMEAVFAGPSTPAQRVQVLLNILGRTSRVHVEADSLEKCSGDHRQPPDHGKRRTRGRGRRINY